MSKSTDTARTTKKLSLKRETIHDLNDRLLTSQGHSLWTCDHTVLPVAQRSGGPRAGDRKKA